MPNKRNLSFDKRNLSLNKRNLSPAQPKLCMQKSSFVDRYFYSPCWYHTLISVLLLPLSWIYALISLANSKLRKRTSYDIPIISIGNLTVGGNGKTPITAQIARVFARFRVFVVLRGYKRKRPGTFAVKLGGQILCAVSECGDEAYEYAMFSSADVIVASKRKDGINLAKSNGAQIILLDDGFSKFHIDKFDILVFSSIMPRYGFCLPSGAYRLPRFCARYADYLAYEGVDFVRSSSIEHTKDKKDMILISSIAKPFRLNEFRRFVIMSYYLADHSEISYEFVRSKLAMHGASCVLCTAKDYVKIKDYGFEARLIRLDIKLSQNLINALEAYVRSFDSIASIDTTSEIRATNEISSNQKGDIC